jgi:D-alanyl-D-alanine carboxypeptidase
MRHFFAALAVVFFIVSCGGNSNSPSSEHSLPQAKKIALDAAINRWKTKFNAPGVVVGIWIPGEGNYVAAHGLANETTGQPMAIQHHFRIGSVSKTVVITVLLQLADEKLISLDDPVSKYLTFVPNGENITLRQLANMTSGLYNYVKDPDFYHEMLVNPDRNYAPMDLVNVAFEHEPDFTPPGSNIRYSNTNTVLLGMIIEQVTQQTLGNAIQERIIEPLGLTNTSWPTSSAMPIPYASGVSEQTLDEKRGDATHINPSWAYAAGNLISNLDDLRVWVQSYTTGTLISPTMQQQRLQWVFQPGNDILGYGLGIGYFNGWYGHTGELPGYNTGGFYLPELDATIVIEVNSDIGANNQNPVPALFQEIARIITPNNLPY